MVVECCFRVVDKINKRSARKNHGCTKRGDCISIHPEGTDWGSDIMAGDDWRIIRLDIPVTLIESLTAGEQGEFADRDARKRIFSLDISLIPSGIRSTINANRTTVTDLTGLNVVGYVKRKGLIV